MAKYVPHFSGVLVIEMIAVLLLFVTLISAGVTAFSAPTESSSQWVGSQAPGVSHQPNIVFIRTDDQTFLDFEARQPNGRRVFQWTTQLLTQEGTKFSQNFTSLSLCCPSRASVLTGQYAHNHGVLSNELPNGGYFALDHSNTLPMWLQNAGYYTGHLGKYMNEYSYTAGIPPGWDEWYTSKDSLYFNYTLNENGTIVNYGTSPNDYYTDVIGQKAVDFITQQTYGDRPFYLQVDFIAPHGTSPPQLGNGTLPVPAPRHAGLFANYQPPHSPAYNEADVSDKPIEIRNLSLLTPGQEQNIAANTRRRLETLLAVDEQVRNIFRALQVMGQLDKTYIVFTSDNGFQFGEHRIQSGKAQIYDESNRVPLVIRGPGVIEGQNRSEIVANIDLTSTFLQWAGATPGLPQDGRSLVSLLKNNSVNWRQNLLLESFGNYPYTAIRNDQYMYAEYDYNNDGIAEETELYNYTPDACRATADPFQLESQHANPCYANLIVRLHQKLVNLKTCAGSNCG